MSTSYSMYKGLCCLVKIRKILLCADFFTKENRHRIRNIRLQRENIKIFNILTSNYMGWNIFILFVIRLKHFCFVLIGWSTLFF